MSVIALTPELINPLDLPSLGLREKNKLPEIASIYFVISEQDEILYVGRTINLRQRWATHHRLTEFLSQHETAKVSWIEILDINELPLIEESMIDYFKPKLNGKKIAYLIDIEENSSTQGLGTEATQNEKPANQILFEHGLCDEKENGQDVESRSIRELLDENKQLRQDVDDGIKQMIDEIISLRTKNKELQKENERLRAWRDSIIAITKIAPS